MLCFVQAKTVYRYGCMYLFAALVLVLWCSVNGSVCFVRCVSDSVCDLFGERIRNMFGCGCYFVVGCYGVVVCGWMCSIG